MHEAIKAAERTTSGALYTGRGRLRGFTVRDTGTAGTIVFRDGGVSGTIILTVDTPAAIGIFTDTIPGAGIPFGTDLYAVMTNVDGVTVFIAEDRG